MTSAQRSFARLLAALLLLLAAPGAGHATPSFDSIVVFGDSLSDVGTGPPDPPIYGGRFTNGRVWHEYLTASLGIAPAAAHSYGQGGAKSDATNLIPGRLGLLAQVDQYAAASPGLGSAPLFVLWAGANDAIIAPLATPPETLAATAAANLASAIGALAAGGAQDFLVANLPDLAQVPFEIALGPAQVAYAGAYSAAFNQALFAQVLTLESGLGVDIHLLDVGAAFDALLADPGAFGITNTTQGCTNLQLQNPCANPEQYLFWDGIHPTTTVHAGLADQAYAQLVPEPASALLLAFGLVALSVVRRSCGGRGPRSRRVRSA